MAKNSDNVFELGLLYQAITTLKELSEKMGKHKLVQRDINKTIGKLKALLVKEIQNI